MKKLAVLVPILALITAVVMSCGYTHPIAWHTSTDCLSLYDSTGWMAYDLEANSMIAHEGGDGQRQLQQARALLQFTSHDLKQK